jgi:hypothetical protein
MRCSGEVRTESRTRPHQAIRSHLTQCINQIVLERQLPHKIDNLTC